MEAKEKLRRFKFVGTQEEAEGYVTNIPQVGRVYREDQSVGRGDVAKFADATMLRVSKEWEEVFEGENPTLYEKDLFTGGKNQLFYSKVEKVLDSIKDILVSKNKKYGNSALDPVRIFSKSSTSEQILVRIDDKLSRIKTMGVDSQIDEDTIDDLIGYLVLLKISK